MNKEEVIEKLDLKSIKFRTWICIETSTITGQGMYEALDWMASVPIIPKIQPSETKKEEKEDVLTNWLKRQDEPDERFLSSFFFFFLFFFSFVLFSFFNLRLNVKNY